MKNLTTQTEQSDVPMFIVPDNQENQTSEATQEISMFDVKDLYDRAYVAKNQGIRGKAIFKKLLAEAVKLDLAYRRQLSQGAMFKDKSKQINFNKACEGAYA